MLATALDLESVRIEPGSFVDPGLGDRHSDLLVSTRLAGQTTLVYILFEHQSTVDPRQCLRVLGYLVRVWERWARDHPGDAPLPATLGVVIAHAPDGWTAATELHALVRPSPASIEGLAALVPNLRIVVDDLAHTTNEALRERSLALFPTLALWLLRDARRPDALLHNLTAWADALHAVALAPDGLRALAILVRYLSLVLERERFEQFRDKMKELAPATEEAAMNYHDHVIEEGRQQGRTEGQRATLTKLLTIKFGPLDTTVIERLETATPVELDRALERILSAESLDAVFAE